MTILQFVTMAKRIHDTEGWSLGALSSRATRNAFFERAVGCAHWGHPAYNLHPDPQWHCKDPDGPGGRPQSDDVVVSMPSRAAYDCIPGAGGDVYYFEASPPFTLPPEQFVFVPAKPAGSGVEAPPVIPPVVQPPPPPKPVYPGDAFFTHLVGVPLHADYSAASQLLNAGSATWFARTIWDIVAEGLTPEASLVKHRQSWRAALGLPPL